MGILVRELNKNRCANKIGISARIDRNTQLVFKNFYSGSATITVIENIRMIQKGQAQECDAANSTFHKFCALMA